VFAIVPSFSTLINTWINISVSYFYDSSINSYFPAMMNFQVNLVPYAISANIENLLINSIVIPSDASGLYAKLRVSPKYIVGPWAEIGNISGNFKNSLIN
jgi:hypothetical protein